MAKVQFIPSKRIAYFIGILSLLMANSCDYARKQEIPDSVSIKSSEEVCSFSIYKVFKSSLEGVDETKTSDWQKGLVCEGYSDRPMNLPWTSFNQLSTETKATLDYFFDNLETCNNYKLDLDKSWVAACQTETINEVSESLNVKYHVLYILDRQEAVLYEIRNLD